MSTVLNSFLIACLVLVAVSWLPLFYETVRPYFSETHRVTVISLAPASGELQAILAALLAEGRDGCHVSIFHRRNPVALATPVDGTSGPPPQIRFEKHAEKDGEPGLRMLIPVQDHFGEPAAERLLRAYGEGQGAAFPAGARGPGELRFVEIDFGRDTRHAAGFAQHIRAKLFGPHADDSCLLNFSGAEAETADGTKAEPVNLPRRPLRALMHYFPEWRRSDHAQETLTILMVPVIVAGLAGLVFATLVKFGALLWGWNMDWRVISLDLHAVVLNIPNYEFLCVGMVVAGFVTAFFPVPEPTPEQEKQGVPWTTVHLMFVSAGLLLFTIVSWVGFDPAP